MAGAPQTPGATGATAGEADAHEAQDTTAAARRPRPRGPNRAAAVSSGGLPRQAAAAACLAATRARLRVSRPTSGP